jgi:long-chain acyl-CoA synthetase
VVRGSIGKPLPGREVKITEEGEILVRGAMVTGATWSGGAMHAREGEWLATGDLAERSESGELRFLGRKGDVIVTGAGMNVYPGDLEAAMTKQTGVRGCVVVACEFAGGAEPVAVVLFNGSDAEMQAAVAEANRGLAEYQQMRRALRWPELQFPYTSTGKVIRREVARWACSMLAGRRAGAGVGSPGRDVLLEMIAEVTGERVTGAGDGDGLRLSEDLHLDSLGRVQLQSVLEQRLGLELEDDAVANLGTLGDLRAMVEREMGGRPIPVEAGAEGARAAAALPTATAEAGEFAGSAAEHVYPRWPWSWPVRVMRVVWIELLMRPLVWVLGAPRVVRETEQLPEWPVLIVANHVTAYDGALVLYALAPRVRRRVAIAMQGAMLLDYRRGRNQANGFLNLLAPVAYWLITALFNVFPLPQARGFRRSFAHAGEAMDRGYSVMIFPEGTRSRDGELHAFRSGIGLLAQESNVPIVPVALVGLGAMKAGQVGWFHTGRLEVRVGKAIPAEAQGGEPGQVAAMLEERVRALLAGGTGEGNS